LPGALFDFHHLTARERVQLAKELWESLADQEEDLPLTPAQSEELDRRLAAYQRDRDLGLPWAEEALRALEDDPDA
jgi:putative addiction module component (TIGR02574 family)